MTLHYNIGFNCKSSDDMATEITKNRRFWPPYSRLRLLPTEPPWVSERTWK